MNFVLDISKLSKTKLKADDRAMVTLLWLILDLKIGQKIDF